MDAMLALFLGRTEGLNLGGCTPSGTYSSASLGAFSERPTPTMSE
jgi:hypothetical protein